MATGVDPILLLMRAGSARSRLVAHLGKAFPRRVVAFDDTPSRSIERVEAQSFSLVLIDAATGAEEIEALAGAARRSLSRPALVLIHEGASEATIRAALAAGAAAEIERAHLDASAWRRFLEAIEREQICRRRLERAERRLVELSHEDPETGLLNARGLARVLRVEQERLATRGLPLSAVLVRGRGVLRCRESFGPEAAELMVHELGGWIRRAIRVSDHLARLGEADFVVLLSDVRPAEARRLSARLCSIVAHENERGLDGAERLALEVATISLPSGTLSVPELYSALSDELHLQQELARDEQQRRARAENSARDASEDEAPTRRSPSAERAAGSLEGLSAHLAVAAQPIVDVATGALRSVELLVREQGGRRRSPIDLFAEARTRLVLTPFDLTCLRLCLEATEVLAPGLEVHVNVLPTTLLEVDASALAAALPASRRRETICFELSEQQLVGGPDHMVEAVENLLDAGFRVALDDVGFGRSQLESLLLMRPHVVKIDRALVRDVHLERRRAAALSRLARVIGAVDAVAVAEGVECEEERRVLEELGINLAQGYLFGRPRLVFMSEGARRGAAPLPLEAS